MTKKVPISLEFFPAKSKEGSVKLQQTRQDLYALKPEYCSVTFGAGGSTQVGTIDTVCEIQHEGYAAAAHISCIGVNTKTLKQHIDALLTHGIGHVVALRGDLPSGGGYASGGELHYASDLVSLLRHQYGQSLHISVAAYPEMHPQAKSPKADLDAFIFKVKAGANDAITQYFYNPDAYFRFRDEVIKRGVTVPIIPGIMPITNSQQLMRFSDSCGTEIPRWLRLRLQSFGDDSESIRALGLEVVTQLCDKLIANDAPSLHFFSMNHSSAVLSICKNFGWITSDAVMP
jgi:methylenetetrahydrofolate reductase (NADPH)